ncbi:ComF family protein [Enterococcus sp. LJL120]
MKCSYCNHEIIRNLSLGELLLPQKMKEWELCQACHQKFTFQGQVSNCSGCQKPMIKPGLCSDCQFWRSYYPKLEFQQESLFVYDAAFSEWLKEYKILGNYQLRHTFTKEVKGHLKKYRKEKFLICPLPLSKKRYRERGFNQVSSLLTAAAIPITELLKRRETAPQALKNRQERLAMPQPFKLKAAPEKITGKKILLVDDVYTTGRTMYYAAVLLQSAGARQILGFSLAR